MNDTFAIAVRILDELERQRMVSLFDIMAPQLQHHWVVTAPGDAAAVILDSNEPGSERFQEACKQLGGAVPVLLAHANPLQAEWFLQRPLKVNAVIALLNRLGTYLQARSRQVSTVDVPAESATNPYRRLRQMFEHLQAQPAYYRFDIGAGWNLFYDSVRDRILLPQEQARPRTPSQTVQDVVQCFQQRKLSAIPVERFKSVSNDPRFALFSRDALIWIWCLNDNGAETRAEKDSYQLTRWPNLATLPHTASHLKLCQFMSSHLANPQAIAANTDVPLHTVNRFCNACEALGLVAIRATAMEGLTAQPLRQSGT